MPITLQRLLLLVAFSLRSSSSAVSGEAVVVGNTDNLGPVLRAATSL